jgi:hypothetical protein
MFEGLGTLIVVGVGEKMAGLAAFGTAIKLTPLAVLTVAAIPLVIVGTYVGVVAGLRKNNQRNKHGFKDSINTYLTIKGCRYEQFSDHKTKEECQKEFPNDHFISRTIDGAFTRVYRKIKSSNTEE